MNNHSDFQKLLNPASIAVIGASNSKTKSGGRFLRSFKKAGYKGKLYPVNPKENKIHGLKSYPSVLDIPGEIDLAYVTVPASSVPGVVADCSEKGVDFVIVHSAGFSESGKEGKILETDMIDAVINGKPRILGPNCMGLYSPGARINTATNSILDDDKKGPVSFAAQSGWVPYNTVQTGHTRGVRFNTTMSIGNQSDITIENLLEYFGSNADSQIIAFYIEGLKNGREFVRLAREISKKKPIVVLKGGRSTVGSRAATSHTGSLAGNNTIFHAAMKQSGVTVAHSIEELVDHLVAFHSPYLPQGNKVGFMVESGGGGIAGSDSATENGLTVPVLSQDNQKELNEKLQGIIPPFSMPKNPVDLVWPPVKGRLKLLVDCAEIILREVDSLVIIDYLSWDKKFTEEITKLRDRVRKPIFLAPCFPTAREKDFEKQTLNGLPSYTIPERAVKSLAALVNYAEYRRSFENGTDSTG